MNIVLWIVQGLVGFALFASGGAKALIPRTKLLDKMKWAASWSDGAFKLLGTAEAIGAVGVIVPWLTGIAPVLTPIAAACLFVIMVGAAKTHIDLKESFAPPAVLAALCLVVAVGRSGLLR